MGLKSLEIEFKYSAKDVSLKSFKEFCENRNPLKFKIISGYDHFYLNEQDHNSFYRHRVNTNENQLTFKRKTVLDNSFVRQENNIDLPLDVPEKKIAALCEIHNYFYNASIFKNCFVYNYDYYTLVYYICYDLDMQEVGRYTEIEMKEDYDWANEEEAWGSLVALERFCKPIGAKLEARIKESLFEMHRKLT